MDLREISSIDVLASPEAIKRFSPKGGVSKPISQFITRTTPKCMGSTPRDVITGKRTGVTSMMVAGVSMNMPLAAELSGGHGHGIAHTADDVRGC